VPTLCSGSGRLVQTEASQQSRHAQAGYAGLGQPILYTEGLTKAFHGFIAVNNVSFSLGEGSIHALIGPNGAGKTTLFNLLSKFMTPDSGRIVYRGRDISGVGPADVARIGIIRSFQISAVFPHFTAIENVRIALQRQTLNAFNFWRSSESLAALDGRAETLLDSVGLRDFRHRVAAELAYGQKRTLELATTLALAPDLMLLDEPMAGMGQEDIIAMSDLIRRAARNRTVLMVEHNMKVVERICDRITVLTRGEILAEGTYAEVSRDRAVVQAYLGSYHA
jgi:branched-chain amino acid transport system ATP-binding protein